MKLNDIELAFEFVSSGQPFENTACVSRSTGQTYWRSEMAGEDDMPEGWEEDEDLVEIPHRNDLDLGTQLVWKFVRNEMPDNYERIREIFSGRGAYRRYKSFLEQIGLLETWYEFENSATSEAMRIWCKDNNIELDD